MPSDLRGAGGLTRTLPPPQILAGIETKKNPYKGVGLLLVSQIFRYSYGPAETQETKTSFSSSIMKLVFSWVAIITLVTYALFSKLDIKSVNLQYNTLARWVAGTNDSSTNHLMFQVLFFFSQFLVKFFYKFLNLQK